MFIAIWCYWQGLSSLGGWCFILFEVLIGGGLVIFIERLGVVELATDDSVILLTAETIESTESVLVRYNSEANSNLTDLLINYRLETVMIRKWKIIDNTGTRYVKKGKCFLSLKDFNKKFPMNDIYY